MEKEFVTYDLSKRLYLLGYNERNLYHYCNGILQEGITYNSDDINRPYESVSAPLWQQAFLFVMQFPQIKKYRYNVALYSDGTYSLKDGKDAIYEYLSAESCLEKLIEIVEREK
jgi:hypothetical protein